MNEGGDKNDVRMAIAENIGEERLRYLYGKRLAILECRSHIKQWCVSVWVLSLGFVSTQVDKLGLLIGFLFVLVPVLIFWFLESIFTSGEALVSIRINDLSSALLRSYSSVEISSWEKLKILLSRMFLAETIVVFYLLLVVASALAIVCFSHCNINLQPSLN